MAVSRALAALLLSGCHLVFGVEAGESPFGDGGASDGGVSDGGGGGDGGDDIACDAVLHVDPFDSLADWSMATDTRTSVGVNAGVFVVTLADATQDDYASIRSSMDLDMSGASWVDVELIGAIAASGADTFFDIEVEDGWYGFAVRNGQLEIGYGLRSASTTNPRTYNMDAHRYLRIAHDVLNDEIVFSVRAVNGAWAEADRVEVQDSLPIGISRIGLGAGNSNQAMITGTSQFDNFRLCAPPSN